MKTLHDPSNKPYYKCLLCPDFRNSCAGLPTRDMTLPEWCEMIRDVMDYFGMHNADVAKDALVSEKTVEKIRAGTLSSDIMRATERGIERAVLGSAGNNTCFRERKDTNAERIIAELETKVEFLRNENDLKAEIIRSILAK